MTGIGDALVSGPAPRMPGDAAAAAGDRYLLQPGRDLDRAADHRGIHRVVVRSHFIWGMDAPRENAGLVRAGWGLVPAVAWG
jgi:hypothetical protein